MARAPLFWGPPNKCFKFLLDIPALGFEPKKGYEEKKNLTFVAQGASKIPC